MSTGADPKTMPVTAEYEEGYRRIYGDRKPVRGTFIYDKRLGKCVPIEEYQPEETAEARHAPIMVDRFYENASTTTLDDKGNLVKVDIGSRKKHREYMREHGLTTADDYGKEWQKRAAQREMVKEGRLPDKTRREALARKLYDLDKP